jgi:hypothetical protein
MKCELCHKAEAQTAIMLEKDGAEPEELYVCRQCAAGERLKRQKQSQRTRKIAGTPPGMSITVTGAGEPPPFIGAIIDAVNGMVNDFGKPGNGAPERKRDKMHDLPLDEVPAVCRYRGRLHLEALHLIGELEPVDRAVRALKMELRGVTADGVRNSGHAFVLSYTGPADRARRVLDDIVRQECNARIRLFEDMPRVFGDSLCRALAILKTCRLLSPGELYDLISPLRLAAIEGMLDGVTSAELEAMAESLDLTNYEDRLSQEERDRVDAGRADEMNRRFIDVVLNEKAEEKFL